MVNVETLWLLGKTLFCPHSNDAYFDMKEERVKDGVEFVDVSLQIAPEKIFRRFEEGVFAGKMLIYSDEDFQDTSRYLPLPFLSIAKENQDLVKIFGCDESDLVSYGLHDSGEFAHDFTNFKRVVTAAEKEYIAKAAMWIYHKVSESKQEKVRREYRIKIAKQWCDMHGIAYQDC